MECSIIPPLHRAASEWIIRNGGKVKFSTSKTWQSNFSMVTVSQNAARLVAIHADEASLTDNGFEHLGKMRLTFSR